MKNFNSLLIEYKEYHQTKGNFITHCLGIPLIVFSLLIFLSNLHFFAPWAFLSGMALTYNLWGVDSKITFTTIMLSCILAFFAKFFDPFWGIGFFVGGWIIQGIGHYVFEKKAPAFLSNFTHLLVGPIFLVSELFYNEET